MNASGQDTALQNRSVQAAIKQGELLAAVNNSQRLCLAETRADISAS
jgi:hypothetical protein